MLLGNCRSITNNVDDLAHLINMTNLSVVLGPESWLNSENSDSEIFPVNCTSYRRDWDKRGVGAFTIVKKKFMLKCCKFIRKQTNQSR